MKKNLLLSAILMAIAILLPTESQAYDFSAVAPSGQTLYYNCYIYDYGNYAQVTTQNSSLPYYNDANKPTGDLTIPSMVTYNGTTYSVTSIGEQAFRSCEGLTSVTIPNSITAIGDYAFHSCIGLTSVTIPNSVTAIGDYAFHSCIGLTSVTIPNSVTSIRGGVFWGCTNITSITIPNSVTSINQCAFLNCTGLTSINIPNSVSFIGPSAFHNCTSLTSPITIPNSVTTIYGNTFQNCRGLTSITIGNSVSTIGDNAFDNCTSLCNFSIPSSVTSIGNNAFYHVKNVSYDGNATGSPWGARTVNGYVDDYFIYADASRTFLTGCCSSVQGAVTIPNSVTTIGQSAFENCIGLTSVTIPNSVTTISQTAFYECRGLTSVTIPSSVTSIKDSAFFLCTGLTSMVVESGNEVYDSRNNCNAIIKTATNTIISGCKNTTIPSSVTAIGKFAFAGCSGLTSITIPNSVSVIDTSAFNGCTGLTSINIPSSVTKIPLYAFRHCSSLTSIDIPPSVTSIGVGAFSDCRGIKSVTIGNSVISIGNGAFSYDDSITSVYYNGDIAGWCNIDFGNGYSNPVYNAKKLYINNSLVTNLVIPEGITKIKQFSFIYLPQLLSISLPNTIKYIGWSGLAADSNLTSITLPESLDSLANWSLAECTGLRSIQCLNPIPPIVGDTTAFKSIDKSIPIYVPRGSASAYQSAYGWSLFSNFIDGSNAINETTCQQIDNYHISTISRTIKIDGVTTESIHVFDLTGRTVYKGTANNPIHVPSSGVYMVKVGERPSRKVVVRP